jgi:CheY-like chemotaxis protein
LENILFEQLKLFNYTSFYNSGASILRAIREMYFENEMNIVALVIIDYKMRDMNGIQLIEQARNFLRSMDVPTNEMPVFAFKDQQFWELPLEITQTAFSLGVQTHHLIKKITEVNQMKKYFKKIGY